MADLPPERLLTRRQTAELIGTSERTLRRWEEQQVGPPALRFSRRMTRYNIEAVREWLDTVNDPRRAWRKTLLRRGSPLMDATASFSGLFLPLQEPHDRRRH